MHNLFHLVRFNKHLHGLQIVKRCCIDLYFVFDQVALVCHNSYFSKRTLVTAKECRELRTQDHLREADSFWDGDTFGVLAMTPGKSATKAMAVSCIMFHHVKMSPTPERLERMAPVCTQMKL